MIREGLARIQEPRLRRDLFLILADCYRLWQQEDKLIACLRDWAAQCPSDIQPRRQLLACPEIVKDPRQAQDLVEEIKSLEGDSGWQWRYEQARLWHDGGAEDFKTHYSQIVKLLQENLAANPQDLESCLLWRTRM